MSRRCGVASDAGAAALMTMLVAGWIEPRAGAEIRHDTEPGTSPWQRTANLLLWLLHIEWML